MSELQEVDAWLAALLANLEPAARTKMLREVARDLRRIQQKNITAQRSPDGTTWEPRRMTARTKQGRIRRKMFTKLKTAKFLKAKANANEAEVAFTGRVQRIARVHHYGLRDRVSRGGKEVKYTARPLLGVNGEVETTVQEALLRWLSE
nr:MAG TPA: virion morphogenesis protein [Caudoviricetes sp.]